MNIQDAIEMAMGLGTAIRRQKWAREGNRMVIFPTNTSYCCFVAIERNVTRGWEPAAEDLIANDWIVTH